MNLDKHDRRILYELDRDARTTSTAIAEKLRRSKQFVDYRIRRLEGAGVLKGYGAVIDYARLGYQSVRVYFKFRDLTPKEQDALEEDLIRDPSVWWLVTLEGVWDVGYAMAVHDLLEFYTYWDRLMTKYRRHIARESVVIYTHIQQYPKAYLIGEPNDDPGTMVGAVQSHTPIDETDRALLGLLATAGRTPLIDLASSLETSPQVVRNRMRRLEREGILQGYRAAIDVSHLGYRYFKSYLTFADTQQVSALDEHCRRHPNILNVNRTIGGKDYEIELQARTFEEFDAIMRELRGSFPGLIDEYEFVIAREEKKMVYFPFAKNT